MLRVDGDLAPISDTPLDPEELKKNLISLLSEQQKQLFETQFEMDLSYELTGKSRFRVNIFHQARGVSAAFRLIPSRVIPLAELDLPEILKRFCNLPRGLVLVTGPTGSGKSTTLASMIDHINVERAEHILTLEDPIEFMHQSKKSLIQQREVSEHTGSFNDALRSALREDPDVILVGEMRDIETVRLALTAAETGHLVFATLHTSSAAKTINRIIDVFPGDEKGLIRSMLSESLQAVIAQVLLKRVDSGRVAAHEIMTCSPAVRNLIREDKVPQLYSAIQTGSSLGMNTLEQSLQELIAKKIIAKETAAVFQTNRQA